MKQPTEQQIARALKETEGYEGDSAEYIRRIAPLVQFPWSESTDQESSTFGAMKCMAGTKAALDHFIRARNAALLPPPVDSRREKIASVIALNYGLQLTRYIVADAILAALDNTQSR